MCLAFFRNLFAKKAAEASVVAAFLAMNSATSPPAAAAVAGGGGGAPGALPDFTLSNFNSGAGSPVTRMTGHLFKDGDIPSTRTLIVDGGADYAVIPRRYNAAGDLIFAHICLRDTDIAASSSRAYTLNTQSGGSYDTTDHGTTVANIITLLSGASNAATVAFTSVATDYSQQQIFPNGTATKTYTGFVKTGYTITSVKDGFGTTLTSPADYSITNGSGTTYQGQSGYDGFSITRTNTSGEAYITVRLTWTHMSGTMRAALSDADVAGRIREMSANSLFKRFITWSMVKDAADGSGTSDLHLKVYWMIDIWYSSGSTVGTVYIKPIIALDWHAVANKTMFNYTAALKKGTTTLDTYSSCTHAYHCWNALVRQDNSNWAARKHAFYGTPESVNPSFDLEYWDSVEMFPRYDIVDLPTDNASTAVYTPLGANGHRAEVDGSGTYAGRGWFPTMDVAAHLLGSHHAHRESLVAAYAGHSFYSHYRGNDAATDHVIRCKTLILDQNGVAGASNTWEADGMPTASYFNRDGRGSADTGGYVAPNQPNGGAFTPTTFDASHAVNYSGYRWIVDGDDDFLQCMFDASIYCVGQMPADEYATRPHLQMKLFANWDSAYTIPSGQWSSIPQLGGTTQERCGGWAHLLLGMAAGLCPEDYMEWNWWQDWAQHCADYNTQSLAQFDTAMTDIGAMPHYIGGYIYGPWQQTFKALGALAFTLMTGKGSDYATFSGNFPANMLRQNPLKALYYWACLYHKCIVSGFDQSTNPFPDKNELGVFDSATCVAATNVWTMARTGNAGLRPIVKLTNGDIMIPSRYSDIQQHNSSGDTTFVSPLVEHTQYYVGDVTINATTMTFKLYSDSGLTTVVDMAADDTQQFIVILKGGIVNAYLDGNGDQWTPEAGYTAIHAWVASQYNKYGHAQNTNALVDQAISHLGQTDWGDYRVFKPVRY